jgi:hypothetical protein
MGYVEIIDDNLVCFSLARTTILEGIHFSFARLLVEQVAKNPDSRNYECRAIAATVTK